MASSYGSTGTSDGGPNGRRRRSTLSVLTDDFRHSIVSTTSAINKRLRSHLMSILTICTCVLSMMYLLMNAFPYSGFMAMQLVPGLTHESAGTYAGILSGSFMIGRLFSAYPWGRVADIYGRKYVMIVSNLISAVLSVAFGFSPNFAWAVSVRFLMGLGNGIMIVARVSVTELAKGDHELEAKGMGLVMSMVGYGMLFGPAIGGVLSEPMQQYPDANWFGGQFDEMLTNFPFVLPNLIGAILCLISTFLVVVSVEETLPPEKLRSAKHAFPDFFSWTIRIPARCWESMKACFSRGSSERRSGYEEIDASSTDNDDDVDSIEEDLEILANKDFTEMSALMTTRSSRASYHAALHRPSVITVKRMDETKSEGGETKMSSNMGSLMANKRTKACLISYWSNTLSNCAVSEAFPLFCMSKEGGLGLEETDIGIIGAGSGLLFCMSQYLIFSFSMKRYGLHKTIVFSSFLSVIPAILTPLSLLLSGWAVVVFLSTLNAIMWVFFSNFNAGITITQNRTVAAEDRAKLNGLAAVGASVGRGGGPLFAGVLVAVSLSSGIIPSQFGSILVYSILAAMGVASFVTTYQLEPEQEGSEETTKEDVFDAESGETASSEGKTGAG